MEPTPDDGPRRAAVVYHPGKVRLESLRRAVTRAEAEHGWGPTAWIETSETATGDEQARSAAGAGYAMVVAAGGDGTVRSVVDGLLGTDVALGLVPTGTGNLLARNLGLPLANLEQAVQVAYGAEERRIDVGSIVLERPDGETDEHAFLVVAGLGIDAEMIEKTSPALKRALGWVAYFGGLARVIPGAKPYRATVSIDGQSARAASVHTLLVANCGMLPGGVRLMPEAQPDDGRLDIAAIRSRGPFGFLRVWSTVVIEQGVLQRTAFGRRLMAYRVGEVEDVIYRQAGQLVVTVGVPVGVQLDGDSLGEAIAARFRVLPGAIAVKASA